MSKISVHSSRFTGETAFSKTSVQAYGEEKDKTAKAKKNGSGATIFAGDTNISFADQMGQKKADAQKQALKRILEVFDSDLEIDQALKDSAQHKEDLSDQIEQYDLEIEKLNQKQQDLKEEYSITDDSEEEQNLNLLRKSFSNPLEITEEDMTQLEQMGQIIEYQKASLENDAALAVWQDLKDEALQTQKAESGNIQAIKLARLKSDPMVGAQKEAQAIMDAATESIVDLIYEKARENLEEIFGGTSEEAKDKTEEVQEEEPKDEDEKLDVDKITEDMTDVQKNILERFKKFIKSQSILEEDVLGIKVDEFL